jgi:hypothetical protein
MEWIVAAGLVVSMCGCGAPSGNAVLNNSADKASVEAVLRKNGIDHPVIAMVDYGDFWLATVSEDPPTASPDGRSTLKMPPTYKVFKDDRGLERSNVRRQ